MFCNLVTYFLIEITFRLSKTLFTFFKTDSGCKYRNFFVTLHAKRGKNAQRKQNISILSIKPFNKLK